MDLIVVFSGWILARRPVFHVCQIGEEESPTFFCTEIVSSNPTAMARFLVSHRQRVPSVARLTVRIVQRRSSPSRITSPNRGASDSSAVGKFARSLEDA